jgi:hypothetical protein
MTESATTRRLENRRGRLREILDRLSKLRLCGPSDDPDEQTAAIESYRYLLINVKILSKGIVPSEISDQLDTLRPGDIELIYDVYQSKAHLDAIAADIKWELENPSLDDYADIAQTLIAPKLLKSLREAESANYDFTKLRGYCKEINSSFYSGNFVACLLLMRTVLNHIPPVFGYQTFKEVVSNSGKSLKENLEHLDNGLRKLADLYAHQTIKAREQYATKSQVEPFRPQFELLLQEVLNKAI